MFLLWLISLRSCHLKAIRLSKWRPACSGEWNTLHRQFWNNCCMDPASCHLYHRTAFWGCSRIILPWGKGVSSSHTCGGGQWDSCSQLVLESLPTYKGTGGGGGVAASKIENSHSVLSCHSWVLPRCILYACACACVCVCVQSQMCTHWFVSCLICE